MNRSVETSLDLKFDANLHSPVKNICTVFYRDPKTESENKATDERKGQSSIEISFKPF